MNTDQKDICAVHHPFRSVVSNSRFRLAAIRILTLAPGLATGHAADSAPPNIRLLVSLVEVPHTELTNMLSNPAASGPELFTAASALVKTGLAETLDTAVLTTRDGQMAEIETIREVIFGTEYEQPELSSGNTPSTAEHRAWLRETGAPPLIFYYSTPTAWDTRNVGLTISATPVLSQDTKSVTLAINPEWVEYHGDRLVRPVPGPFFRFDIKMPDFRTLRSNTNLTIPTGAFELVSVLTPMNQAPVPAPATKVLLFVRCDVPGRTPP